MFEKGSTLVKVKVIKDNHTFFIHIIDPQISLIECKSEEESLGSPEEHEIKLEKPINQGKPLSKFGSFSATLENEIHLSFSCYGASGKAAEETDPYLATILAIPSVNLPTSSFLSSALSAAAVPATGKAKPGKEKSAKSLPSAKVSSRMAMNVSPEESPVQDEKKSERNEPIQNQAVPETRVFNTLNVSSPNGLVLTFIGQKFSGEEKGEKDKNDDEDSKTDETKSGEVKLEEIKTEDSKEKQAQPHEPLAKDNGDKTINAKTSVESGADLTIKNEIAMDSKAEMESEDNSMDKESPFEIFIRQSYPQRVKQLQLQKTVKKPIEQEVSRVITRQGTVVKYMIDGSTQILFADGTVIRSPDSGPVIPPPPAPSTPHTEITPTLETSTKKGRKNTKGLLAGKNETMETIAQEQMPEPEQSTDAFAGTWITTTPLGIQIGTKGTEKLDLKPLLSYQATDPVNGTVMVMREDKVLMVEKTDGSRIVDHADGTRISTLFQECVEIVSPNDSEEADSYPQTTTRKVKCMRIENPHFATVLTNSEDSTCCAVFADGTSIISKPQGTYQILPINKGSLFIDENYSAVYSPEAFEKNDSELMSSDENQRVGKYIMKHNSKIVCEMTDVTGNIFKVMADGSTSTFIPSIDAENKVTEPAEIQTPVIYGEHAPRFFIVHADGSGTELLRTKHTEEYLAMAYGHPTITVLREAIKECPGVLSITVLCPLTEVSQWIMKKDSDTIVPYSLQSRDWENFPPVEPCFQLHL
ncbi:PREDICTED: sperm-associated antigen 17-like isoform X2 [Thamnophis sirtalis]|uniref:Sperm-associated antigen 17-like isoform X2 n=1 Tax=Thamnophis sirtalis TaxID=35019 RepID=A0A6I9Z0G5_9SAUR|nr:PREDICTED: sperm-associated antigen 17-like isoform X2 [Thamnophis sirtalis]